MTNRELMRKADWAVGDLQADGGLLNPEQANAFIRKLILQPTLLRQVRTVTMNSPQRNINKIQFAERILMPAPASGTALDPNTSATNRRSKPTTEQIQLNTNEVIAEVRLPYDVIEDNIERGNIGQRNDTSTGGATGGIKDTIMTMIAERAALDLEELALHGDDPGGADAYLQLTDGYLKRITSNVVDFLGNPIDKSLFKQGLQAMPNQYLRNLNAMRHWVSVDKEIAYRDSLAQRETALGDNIIQGTSPVYGYGVQVERLGTLSLLGTVSGDFESNTTGDESGILTFPLNMIFGIQRRIHIETDKNISERVYIIVLTMRMDFQIEEELAAVKYINVGE